MNATDSVLTYFDVLVQFVKDFSLDVIIIGIIFAFFFFFALYFGKSRVVSLLLAFYIVPLVLTYFPYGGAITVTGEGENALLFTNLALLGFSLIIFSIIINRVTCAEFDSGPIKEWSHAALLAVSGVALVLAFSYHIIPITPLYNFAAPLDVLFTSATHFFWWLLVPLGAIFLTASK